MIYLIATTAKLMRSFLDDESGIAMTEAIIAVPFLTFIAVGVLEFSAILWQREEIESGLRDAARYVARCPDTLAGVTQAGCETTARNLAFYGTTAAGARPRVPGWVPGSATISFSSGGTVTATTTHTILHSPLFSFLGISDITITARHQQRDIGW